MQYKIRFFIVAYFFISCATFNGMQNNIKFDLERIQEVTLFNNPYCIHHVTNDIVAMNSISKFGLVDIKKKQIQYIPYEVNRVRAAGHAIIQSDNKKIVLANGPELMIYDQETKDHQWFDCGKINSLKIDPLHDAFFCMTNGSTIKYNYTTNQTFDTSGDFLRILDIDSEKQMMWVYDYQGNISIRPLHNLEEECATIEVPEKIRNIDAYTSVMYRLSPDKSYLACGNPQCIYKITLDGKAPKYRIQLLDSERLRHIMFLPKGNILATISQSSERGSIIRYWDFFQELVNPIYMLELNEKGARDISIAPSGLEILIAFPNKCIRSVVPFQIKKYYSYLFFVLNELKNQRKISQDILVYSMVTLLKYLHF